MFITAVERVYSAVRADSLYTSKPCTPCTRNVTKTGLLTPETKHTKGHRINTHTEHNRLINLTNITFSKELYQHIKIGPKLRNRKESKILYQLTHNRHRKLHQTLANQHAKYVSKFSS